MKRFFSIIIPLSAFFFLSVTCYADINWPPPAYDMPLVLYTPDSMQQLFSSVKLSFSAFTATGLKLMGVSAILYFILAVPMRTILEQVRLQDGVKSRQFQRKIRALDRDRNRNEIIDDKVAEMEISHEAKWRFRWKNPNADLNEKVYQKLVGAHADLAFMQNHKELDIQRNVARLERSFDSRSKFEAVNENALASYNMHKRVGNRVTAAKADIRFRNEYNDLYLEHRSANGHRFSSPKSRLSHVSIKGG